MSDVMETEKVLDPPGPALEPTPEGIETLYRQHAPAMVRLAFLLTRDGALAEDIVQDAFVKVTGRLGHMRSMGAFDGYLRRAVVNRCLSHHRHAKVERDYVARAGAEQFRGGVPSVHGPDLETRDEVIAALETLPDRQRAVVVLRFYEDLSEQQVADALRCSVTAARSLLFRAMAALRSQLGTIDDAKDQEDPR